MTSTAEIKDVLLYEFSGHLGYRQEKAERHDKPWDQHNAIYGTSLERMIAYIESLADDAPALQKLQACAPLYDENVGGFCLPNDAGRGIVHWGDRNKAMAASECAESFDAWVDDLVSQATKYGNALLDGKRAGEVWAKDKATPAEIRRLSEWMDDYFIRIAEQSSVDADVVFFAISPEEDRVQSASRNFWKNVVGASDEKQHDDTFVKGFCDGALSNYDGQR